MVGPGNRIGYFTDRIVLLDDRMVQTLAGEIHPCYESHSRISQVVLTQHHDYDMMCIWVRNPYTYFVIPQVKRLSM